MIREIEHKDIPSLIWCLQMLRKESPTYGHVANDPILVEGNLNNLFGNNIAFGVIDNDVACKGFMFGVAGPSWYSDKIEAAEQLLYVVPAERGTGLAIKLIKAFELQCKHRGCKSLAVGASVGINDERTERLYERLGYKWHGRTLVKEL